MDQRSIALLEFPLVRARLAAATSFPPSRRLAEALEPSDRPGRSSRAGSTRPTRRGRCSQDRPGVGIGAAHDIGPAIERAARGGRLEPAQFLEIADDARRDGPAGDLARRRAPAAPARARRASCTRCRRCARRWRAASTRSASCSTRPRRGSAACARPSGSPTTGCAGGSTRSSARSSAARSRSRSSRSATGATSCRSRPRPGRGSRASSTTRRAAARRCSSSRSSRSSSATPGARRRSPRPRRSRASSTSCRRSSPPTRTPLRETLDALARFDFWAAKAIARGRAWTASRRAETAERARGRSCCRPAIPGLSGRVVPIDIRLGDGYTRARRDRPEHRRQDRHAADARAAQPDAPGRAPRARRPPGSRLPIWRDVFADIGDEQSIAQSLSTFSGHLRSIIRIVEAAGPGHARPARRARRRDGPDRGLGAGPGAARPLHPGRRAGRRDDPLRRAQGLRPHDAGARATPSVEFDLETLSPTYRLTIGLPGGSQAFAIAERLGLPERDRRATPARGCPRRSARSRRPWRRSRRPRARPARRSTGPGPPSCAPTEALRVAEEERRRARRERDEAVRAARAEAERIVERPARRGPRHARGARARDGHRAGPRRGGGPRRGDARAAARRRATRPPVLEPAVAAARGSSASGPAAGPAAGRAGSPPSSAAASGRRSRPAGCGSRSTSRTSSRPQGPAPTDGPGAPSAASAPTSNAGALRLERARSVASSLDLRGARVDEALDALDRYLDDAALAGLDKVTDHPRDGDRRAARRRPSPGRRTIRWSSRCGRASAARAATARRSSSSEL